MNEYITDIIVAVISSNFLVELARYLIGRSTSKNDVKKRLDKIEKDGVRNQLMTLIHDYPRRTDEIMEVAYHYFVDLKGNWFATGLFEEWLRDYDVSRPKWLDK